MLFALSIEIYKKKTENAGIGTTKKISQEESANKLYT